MMFLQAAMGVGYFMIGFVVVVALLILPFTTHYFNRKDKKFGWAKGCLLAVIIAIILMWIIISSMDFSMT